MNEDQKKSVETRSLELNGKVYAIILPPPLKAMPLSNKVAVLLGPLLGSLGTDVKAGGWDKFAQAMKSVDPDRVQQIFMEAVGVSHLCCNNQPISAPNDFDRHFTQCRQETYQVVIWCLWECVRDFFPQLEGFSHRLQAVADQALKSQTAGQ